jgi:hypothetical protein
MLMPIDMKDAVLAGALRLSVMGTLAVWMRGHRRTQIESRVDAQAPPLDRRIQGPQDVVPYPGE